MLKPVGKDVQSICLTSQKSPFEMVLYRLTAVFECSFIVSLLKSNGDALTGCTYKDLILIEEKMKVLALMIKGDREKSGDRRDAVQLYVLFHGTTVTIFILRQPRRNTLVLIIWSTWLLSTYIR